MAGSMLYYPKFMEFANLAAIAVTLCLINYFIREQWTRRRNAVPLVVSVLLCVGACAVCLFVATVYYRSVQDVRKLQILMWCLLFLMAPVIYYLYSVVDSLAVHSVDRIGPFSAKIEDPSEFSQARRMAIRGDIDGAVQRYRRYQENQPAALFEAARLLKSVDRFVEAGLLLEETAERFQEQAGIWPEAVYQLAKLHEVNLGDRQTALALLHKLVNRAPMARFGQLAASDIARLSTLDGAVLPDLDEDIVSAPRPYFKTEGAAPIPDGGNESAAPHSADPFYKARPASEAPGVSGQSNPETGQDQA